MDVRVVTISQEKLREQFNHVNNVLKAAPEKAMTVYRRALGRALDAGRAQAYKEIRQRYDIPFDSLIQGNHSYGTFYKRVGGGADSVIAELVFAGAKIPLYRFHPSPKDRKYTTRYVNGIGGWRVTTDVSAAENRGAMIRRRTAFIATMPNGHTGIFVRTGAWTHLDKKGDRTKASRQEIRELWGYSVKDMLDYPEAREAIQQRIAEVVRSRVDHELLRALDEIG